MSTDTTFTFPAKRLHTAVSYLKKDGHDLLAEDLAIAIKLGQDGQSGQDTTHDPDIVNVALTRRQLQMLISGRNLLSYLLSAMKAMDDPEWDELDNKLMEAAKSAE